MPMEDTYGIQSRIGSIIVVERWYCCRGSPVFSDRNIHFLTVIQKDGRWDYMGLCRRNEYENRIPPPSVNELF